MTDPTETRSPEEAAKERKAHYRASLNLPKTGFAMRANLHQNEPQSVQRWQRIDLYQRLQEARSDAPPFVFHDGPPYANGSIHTGHLLNKVLKDLVVRSRSMAGFRCPYVPGWDCHGLPIEHRVMTGLLESGKLEKLEGLAEDARRMAVRRECARYATRFKDLQAAQFQRLMTLADYQHPYLTMAPEYEESVLEVFADLIDQGLVYRDLKPVHWSVANETALAEAELEYYDREDPSIFVWFDASDPRAVARSFAADIYDVADDDDEDDPQEPIGFLIWTTTPWTLPANLLIAVAADADYSLVRLDGRLSVVAAARVPKVAASRDTESSAVEVLGVAKGRDLAGLRYRHPLIDASSQTPSAEAFDRPFRIVVADHVTLDDGTGLVHTAPGHGAEDYAIGLAEGAAIYCPVRNDGTYDDTVPEWLRGRSIWDANPEIQERLRASGQLYHHEVFRHSYPHDWRSKTPVIFRATEQWFVAVDRPLRRDQRSLRTAALAAVDEGIRFVPSWGRSRLRGMLEARPDWCLSRQRAWGLPIPAFRTPRGEIFLTAASVRAIAEVFGKQGSDAWFERSPAELLAGYRAQDDPAAPADLDPASLTKLHDIFDVWFESGSSWNAVIRKRDLGYPTDLYLEGSDQHRGWFQLSLLPALGVTGTSPFRNLLTHGFIVDKDSRKMSKSEGNTLEVDDLLKEYGADVCRWWVSSLAYENDIKVDRDFFQLAGESYRKVRNTLRFLLSNLADFEPEYSHEPPPPESIDAWALACAAELRRRVLAAWEAFDFRQSHLLLFDFCNDTLSAVYLDAVKDRLYCDRPDSPRRRRTQRALYEIALLLCDLLAPILPHTADEAYRSLTGNDDDEHTVHLRVAHQVRGDAHPGWDRAIEARDRVLKALERAKERGIENKLDAGVTVPDPDQILAPFLADLPDLFGVSRVRRDPAATAIEIHDLRSEPRCERSWRRDESVRQRNDGGFLSDRDADAVGLA